MKNLLFTTILFLSFFSITSAQEFSLGPTIGLNNSWIDDVPGDTEGLLGLNAGLTLVYSTEVHWGVGLDLKYYGEGVRTKLRNETANTRLNYFRIPLKLIYFFNEFGNDFRPKLYVGQSLGILTGGETRLFLPSGTAQVDSKDLYEEVDLGLLFGTGFNYRIAPATWLNLDLAYAHGITNIAKSGDAYNRNISLNVGLAWGL